MIFVYGIGAWFLGLFILSYMRGTGGFVRAGNYRWPSLIFFFLGLVLCLGGAGATVVSALMLAWRVMP